MAIGVGRLLRLDPRLAAPDQPGRARPGALALRGLPGRPGGRGSCQTTAVANSKWMNLELIWISLQTTESCPDDGDAYAKAGVDQGAADSAVAGLVEALGAIQLGRPVAAGAAAGPLRERDPARRANRHRALHRRGRDQAAGRRGAGALRHGRDRLRGDERQRRDLRRRRAAGDARLHRDRAGRPGGLRARSGSAWRAGPSWPGSRSPAASWPSSARWCSGVDVSGACFGTVALDAIIDGSAVRPGDAVIGLPSSGLHSNGYTLARSALAGISLEDDPEGRLGRPLGEVLLEPTEIYVKPVLELLRSEVEVRGLAHITSGGLGNLLRLAADVGYEIDDPLPAPPIFELIQRARRSLGRGDARGLQHGLRLLLRRRDRGRGCRARPPPPPLPRGEADRLGRSRDRARFVATEWTLAQAAR